MSLFRFIVPVMLIGITHVNAATILLRDDFNGTGGSPPNASLWNAHSSVTLTGVGNVRIVAGGSPSMISDNSFLFEPLEIGIFNNQSGNAILGYENATDWVYIRSDTSRIEVGKAGSVTAFVPFSMPIGAFTFNVEWAASQLSVLVNGSPQLVLTSASQIPSNPMQVLLHRYSTANFTDVNYVQVGVPEPASASIVTIVVGALLSRRLARRGQL